MFKKVKNRNHVLSQPVRKHIKKHTTQKMVLNHPYRVSLLYTTNKNSHKFMCEVWFKWWRVRDSNPWMLAWKASELTVSPTRHITNCLYSITNNIRLRQALFAFFANFSTKHYYFSRIRIWNYCNSCNRIVYHISYFSLIR